MINYRRRTAIVLLGMLTFCGAALATYPYVVNVQHYAAKYEPQPVRRVQQVQQGCDCDAIEARLKRIEDTLGEVLKIARASQETTEPPEAQPSSPPGFLNRGLSRCASCHDATTSDKGGEFVMVQEGKTRQFTPGEWQRILDKVKAGKMPPPASNVKLEDAEKAAIIEWAEGAVKAKQQKP